MASPQPEGQAPGVLRVDHLALQAWQGRVWRIHKRKYRADDPGGSLRVSGRYNRGLDAFPPEATWPALYTACAPEIALSELVRHVTPALLPSLNDYLLTELSVSLEAVLDCTDPAACGLTLEQMVDDFDYDSPQALAAGALARDSEGLLVPSATRLGTNLIILTARLRPASRIAIGPSREPRLQPEPR